MVFPRSAKGPSHQSTLDDDGDPVVVSDRYGKGTCAAAASHVHKMHGCRCRRVRVWLFFLNGAQTGKVVGLGWAEEWSEGERVDVEEERGQTYDKQGVHKSRAGHAVHVI